MKGIILAGGSGSRLYPLTLGISKQLLPIYDKPMIYYPLSVLLLAELTEILIISTPRDTPLIEDLLGDGSKLGIKLSYKVQPSPDGLAQAFLLGEEFLAGDSACLSLGDNIFYGEGLSQLVLNAKTKCEKELGATIFSYYVSAPERYGIIEFNQGSEVVSIEEKPTQPKSNYAATGLYFYDHKVVEYAKQIKPSPRGELEITDLNKLYLAQKTLRAEPLGRGYAWLDAGTHDSLIEASQYIATIEKRQGLKIGCLEEIAWRKGFIDDIQLKKNAKLLEKTDYGQYLFKLLNKH